MKRVPLLFDLSELFTIMSDVCMKEASGSEAILGLMDRHRPSDGEWDQCSRLDIVGFDDISLKKGHRHFVTISTGRLDTATVILGV